ncbi:hypothetical protein KXX11_004869 [Aspergillus fumigatus]|nr:hypothetical protein KXX11_004869 [Aspergillus fumigatus]
MAAYSGDFTNGRRPQGGSSRNIALLSIFAVVAGGYLAFRAQSPSKNEPLVSKKEVETMSGSPAGQGGRVGRGPDHQPKD